MLHRLFCLIRKELQALLNNKQGRIMLIMPVILQTAIFPFAATLEVRNSSLGLYDEDGSAQSVELIQRLSQAAAFTHIVPLTSNRALQQAIDNQSVLIGVHIPADFSRTVSAMIPETVQGRTSAASPLLKGRSGDPAVTMRYNGPYPPDRDHEYYLHVWGTTAPLNGLNQGFWLNEMERALRNSGAIADQGAIFLTGKA